MWISIWCNYPDSAREADERNGFKSSMMLMGITVLTFMHKTSVFASCLYNIHELLCEKKVQCMPVLVKYVWGVASFLVTCKTLKETEETM